MQVQECLYLGSGFTIPKRKLIAPTSFPEDKTNWTRLDFNRSAQPEILFDLDDIAKGKKIPKANCFFDEIHAYSVLEHFGRQGDFEGFFKDFKEFWRLLKPFGLLIGGVPAWNDMWAWGDPGHHRVITEGTISYLTKHHQKQLGITPSTDYRRFIEPCWWQVVHSDYLIDKSIDLNAYYFALQKIV